LASLCVSSRVRKRPLSLLCANLGYFCVRMCVIWTCHRLFRHSPASSRAIALLLRSCFVPGPIATQWPRWVMVRWVGFGLVLCRRLSRLVCLPSCLLADAGDAPRWPPGWVPGPQRTVVHPAVLAIC
jgi:hypothetical protein